MGSPLGHVMIGVGLAAAVAQATNARATEVLWIGAAVASVLPDLDWVGVLAGLPLRRVHRRATHSLLMLSGVIAITGWVWNLLPGGIDPILALAWSLALLSHPVLDVVSTSPRAGARGYGVPLLWPVFRHRWFLQPPLFRAAEAKAYRSLGELFKALLPEIYVLGPASIVLVLVVHLLRSLGTELF